ncbi:MAG: hypothetical protein ACFFCS_11305 [Candidatus Hodarchaeota archaeon]
MDGIPHRESIDVTPGMHPRLSIHPSAGIVKNASKTGKKGASRALSLQEHQEGIMKLASRFEWDGDLENREMNDEQGL